MITDKDKLTERVIPTKEDELYAYFLQLYQMYSSAENKEIKKTLANTLVQIGKSLINEIETITY